MVPSTKAVVICGSSASSLTPPLASKATSTPEIRATQAYGDLKDADKSLKPISPLAIGASTAIVISVTPQFIPFDCIKENDFASKPPAFNKSRTAIAIIKELFFAINPITSKSRRNNNDSLNMVSPILSKLSHHTICLQPILLFLVFSFLLQSETFSVVVRNIFRE